jgi:hypothetical protein
LGGDVPDVDFPRRGEIGDLQRASEVAPSGPERDYVRAKSLTCPSMGDLRGLAHVEDLA